MTSSEFKNFLKSISYPSLHVIDASIAKSRYITIDLSESNSHLKRIDTSTSGIFSSYINNYLQTHNAEVAFGGYNEVRNIYSRSEHFDNTEGKRNIHLGVDFWCDVKTPILVPLDGNVHSFKNNTNYGDYGPTIILEHKISDITFYTLYGHLSLQSILNIEIGQEFKAGKQLATLGNASVNGDYPPHLHFQIIRDLQGCVGDYPGVCAREELSFYLDNCPNPEYLLNFEN